VNKKAVAIILLILFLTSMVAGAILSLI